VSFVSLQFIEKNVTGKMCIMMCFVCRNFVSGRLGTLKPKNLQKKPKT